MRKKKLLCCILILGILVCLLSACKSAEKEENSREIPNSRPVETPVVEEEEALKIVVFASKGHISDGYTIIDNITGPICSVGPYTMGDEFVYGNIIEAFSEETGIPVEIEYSNNNPWLNSGADVLIMDTASYPPTEMMSEAYCYDLSPFFEEYGIYGNGFYLEPILRAGQVGDKQFIFPLTFNMNILMGSEESLARNYLSIEEGMTYEELVDALVGGWQAVPPVEDRMVPVLDQTDWNWGWGDVGIYRLFEGAGGLSYDEGPLDEEGTDKMMINQLLNATKAFLCADFAMDEDEVAKACRTEDELFTVVNESSQSSQWTGMMSEISPVDLGMKIGCVVSGPGRYHYYPFGTQALYYEHIYEEMDESFFCMGIPEYGTTDQYRAAVISYGIVPSGSTQPDKAYQLLQYLADAERPVYYDMSVNRERMAETLDELTKIEIMVDEEVVVGPLSEESKSVLMNLIDHIDEAYFPDRIMDEQVYSLVRKYLSGTISSSGEVYDRLVTHKASLMPKGE